jgi:hypothetical protein
MGITHQVPTVFAEKLITHEIQWRGHMAAAIEVGVKASLIVDEKPIDAVLIAYQPKLLDATRRQLFHFGDASPSPSALLLHAPFIAPENQPVYDQSDDIQEKKKNR